MPIISSRALHCYISREHIVPNVFRHEMEFTTRSNDKKSHLHETSPPVHESYPFLRESSCANRPISLRESYIMRNIWSRTSLNPNAMPICFGQMTLRTSELLPLFSVVIIRSRWLSVIYHPGDRQIHTTGAVFPSAA